jgi:hypothetical protein
VRVHAYKGRAYRGMHLGHTPVICHCLLSHEVGTASTATTCCAGTAGLYAPRQPLQQLQCISARQGAIRVMCTRCVLVQFYSNYVLIRLVLLMSMCEEDEG